jgi:Endonuclease NucS
MEEIKLWKITSEANEKPKVYPLATVNKTTTEQLLEDVLTGAPDLLMPNLVLIGRQSETPGGPLDLLGVDEDGRLVVFELKRGMLTRDAVAQAIDYASHLASLETDDLCRHINENCGKGGTESFDDFAQWYQSHFQSAVADIGRPRVMLVGLGADERAKRMVAFLAQCELDISLITFHGFKQGHETLLARQVEVQSQAPTGQVKSTKLGNQAKLDKLLAAMGIEQNYEGLVAAIKQGLGESTYQWPNPTGYSFYLTELSASGGPSNRSYVALYAHQQRNGAVQVFLQPRAVQAAGKNYIQTAAENMDAKLTVRTDGTAEFWLDGRKPATSYGEALKALGQRMAAGWKAKMDAQASAEAVEVAEAGADGAVASTTPAES